MATSVIEATTNIHAILVLLEPEERQRVIRAALVLLGDEVSLPMANQKGAKKEEVEEVEEGEIKFPPQTKAWMQKNKLSLEQLQDFFHFEEGKVNCIALAGNGNGMRAKALNAYLLQGIAAFLSTGAPNFSDDDARELCKHLGCHDQANHSKLPKSFENNITGSKAGGWKLTAPGLAVAASILGAKAGKDA